VRSKTGIGDSLQLADGGERDNFEVTTKDRERTFQDTSRLIGTHRGLRDDSFGLHSQASFNGGSADAV
jgi:hypothetical protein